MCLGIPGQIVAIDDAVRKLATVSVAGIHRQVNIACIVDATHPVASCVGDWVLVHVGFAMARIDEEEAIQQPAATIGHPFQVVVGKDRGGRHQRFHVLGQFVVLRDFTPGHIPHHQMRGGNIEQHGKLVKLTLTHEGFAEGSRLLDGVSKGWPAILSSLKSMLESGTALAIPPSALGIEGFDGL